MVTGVGRPLVPIRDFELWDRLPQAEGGLSRTTGVQSLCLR